MGRWASGACSCQHREFGLDVLAVGVVLVLRRAKATLFRYEPVANEEN